MRAAILLVWKFATKRLLAPRARVRRATRRIVAPTHFDACLRQALRRAAERGAPGAVILLEPAAAGSDGARRSRIEWALLGASRSTDVVTRFAGLRYGVLLLDADEATARFIAGRIARALSAPPDEAIPIATGIAAIPPEHAHRMWPATVLAAATRALLRTPVVRSGIQRAERAGTTLAPGRLAS